MSPQREKALPRMAGPTIKPKNKYLSRKKIASTPFWIDAMYPYTSIITSPVPKSKSQDFKAELNF